MHERNCKVSRIFFVLWFLGKSCTWQQTSSAKGDFCWKNVIYVRWTDRLVVSASLFATQAMYCIYWKPWLRWAEIYGWELGWYWAQTENCGSRVKLDRKLRWTLYKKAEIVDLGIATTLRWWICLRLLFLLRCLVSQTKSCGYWRSWDYCLPDILWLNQSSAYLDITSAVHCTPYLL